MTKESVLCRLQLMSYLRFREKRSTCKKKSVSIISGRDPSKILPWPTGCEAPE